VAVVALAVAGRGGGPSTAAGEPAASAVLVAAAAPSTQPSRPRVTPSPRSDWPAAIDGRNGAGHPSAVPDPIDWAAMADDRATWAADRAESRRSHRLGAFANYRTDPYER